LFTFPAATSAFTFTCFAQPVATSVFLVATSAFTFACFAQSVATSVFLAATSALTFACFAQSVATSALTRNRLVSGIKCAAPQVVAINDQIAYQNRGLNMWLIQFCSALDTKVVTGLFQLLGSRNSLILRTHFS
jgi:hypothetical protein